jgi:ribonuclease HI
MDIKSYLKSASIEELEQTKKFIENEIKSRSDEPRKIKKVLTYTDGASRGNPGDAGIGVLIFDEKDEKLVQDFQYVGICTNNEAEYRALLLALDRAYEVTQGDVECYMDSELVVRQLNGQYTLKSENLAKYHQEVKDRLLKFANVSFHHVPREHPKLKLADKLANRGIDEAKPNKIDN